MAAVGGELPDRFRPQRGGIGRSILGKFWLEAERRVWAIKTGKRTFETRPVLRQLSIQRGRYF